MSPTSERSVADGSGTIRRGSFSEQLSALEARGASILVTGDVDGAVHAAVGRELLGGPHERRRRVLAFSDPGLASAENWLPTGTPRDPDHLQLVVNGHTRSVATQGSAGADGDPDAGGGPWAGVPDGSVTVIDDDGLDTFGARVADAIGRVTDWGPDVDAGELRVGVCTLVPLVERGGVQAVAKLTHLLSHQVRDARGRSFFHFPRAVDDEAVTQLRPWFDVMVELADDGTPRQRWHVVGGSSSDWFPVEGDERYGEH